MNVAINQKILKLAKNLQGSNYQAFDKFVDFYNEYLMMIKENKFGGLNDFYKKVGMIKNDFVKDYIKYSAMYLKKANIEDPTMIFLGSLAHNIEETISKEYFKKEYPGIIRKFNTISSKKIKSLKPIMKKVYEIVFGRGVFEQVVNNNKTRRYKYKESAKKENVKKADLKKMFEGKKSSILSTFKKLFGTTKVLKIKETNDSLIVDFDCSNENCEKINLQITHSSKEKFILVDVGCIAKDSSIYESEKGYDHNLEDLVKDAALKVVSEIKIKKSSTKKAFGNGVIFKLKDDVELIYEPFKNIVEIGMGGEWWSGKIGFGKNILIHPKGRIDEGYKPVTVNVRQKGHDLAFDIMGGFGHSATMILSLS